MLNKIKALLKKVSQSRPVFDPSVFNNSLAMETQWHPLKGGGSNFRTHKLVSMNYSRLEFKSTFGAKFFCSIFMVVGLAIPGGFAVYKIQQGEPFSGRRFFVLVVVWVNFFRSRELHVLQFH